MSVRGREGEGEGEGDYRSTHLGTILEYLRNQKEEDRSVTLQKLALILGFAQRQIRENYFDGLVAFGIISLTPDCKRWFWVGIKAIKGANGQLRTNNPTDNEFVASNLSEHAKNKPNGLDIQ